MSAMRSPRAGPSPRVPSGRGGRCTGSRGWPHGIVHLVSQCGSAPGQVASACRGGSADPGSRSEPRSLAQGRRGADRCEPWLQSTVRVRAWKPEAAFVTRLRPARLPRQAARQLPDQPTTPWVEPSSTGDTRRLGARRVEDGRGGLGHVGIAPFPVPAHQTGRADLPHPAFRLASPQGTRHGAKMNPA